MSGDEPQSGRKSEDERFQALDRDVAAASAREAQKQRAEAELAAKAASMRQSGVGWAVAIDLLAATLVVGGLGYGLDRLINSSPFGLIFGILAGFGLGMYLAVRRATRQASPSAPPATGD